MSKIIQFKQEECQCPYCSLVEPYYNKIVGAESVEELVNIINELIDKARDVAFDEGFGTGLDVGYDHGYIASLKADIEFKSKMLADIEEECGCDCCNGECDC